MWHVNLESIERYAGEKFHVAWRDSTGAWVNAYSKTSKGVVRIERQEYPHLQFKEAVERKLNRLTAANEKQEVGG